MVVYTNIMRLFVGHRKVYFFGYGADREPDMIEAIIGHRPRVVGPAVLEDYELRVQSVHEITQAGNNPKQSLNKAWGSSFKSYVIVPQPGAIVTGTLFRLSLHYRHLIDKWELVDRGWYKRALVEVQLKGMGKLYHAETQVLGGRQYATHIADGLHYESWLQTKQHFIQMATSVRAQTQ